MDSPQAFGMNDISLSNSELRLLRGQVSHKKIAFNLKDNDFCGRITLCKITTANERYRSRALKSFPENFQNTAASRMKCNLFQYRFTKQLTCLGSGPMMRSNCTNNLLPDEMTYEQTSNPGANDILNEKVKRVLCLMSNTGGGHKASAQALKDGFESIFGNAFEVNIVDLWSSNSPWPLCNMPKSYFFLVKNPWLWRMNFRCSEPKIVHETLFKGYAAIVSKQFSQVFLEYNPHLIVSVHPLMQHVPLMSLKRLRGALSRQIPFTTVVTDLTSCHPTWFHKDVLKCFVATKLVISQALRLGLKSSQIVCHGLPIRPSFSIPCGSRTSLREKLGMQKDAKTVMLIGGGEGMGKISEIAISLSKKLSPEHQVVIICGNNKNLVEKLSDRTWPLKVHIKGFVSNMSEYMSCCDCVITKAGPGTIAEALICGIPIILNGCIPCQEEGNIPFVLDNKVGTYSEDPAVIANIVSEWFGSSDDILEEMSRRAKKLGRPEATFNIVRDLADLAH